MIDFGLEHPNMNHGLHASRQKPSNPRADDLQVMRQTCHHTAAWLLLDLMTHSNMGI